MSAYLSCLLKGRSHPVQRSVGCKRKEMSAAKAGSVIARLFPPLSAVTEPSAAHAPQDR